MISFKCHNNKLITNHRVERTKDNKDKKYCYRLIIMITMWLMPIERMFFKYGYSKTLVTRRNQNTTTERTNCSSCNGCYYYVLATYGYPQMMISTWWRTRFNISILEQVQQWNIHIQRISSDWMKVSQLNNGSLIAFLLAQRGCLRNNAIPKPRFWNRNLVKDFFSI